MRFYQLIFPFFLFYTSSIFAESNFDLTFSEKIENPVKLHKILLNIKQYEADILKKMAHKKEIFFDKKTHLNFQTCMQHVYQSYLHQTHIALADKITAVEFIFASKTAQYAILSSSKKRRLIKPKLTINVTYNHPPIMQYDCKKSH